ncbi:MAG: hypothetical protein SOR58_01925 [Megasphaera massiliensis]|uniref:hypothetical protein n=1 Tax=Megasphaera massiliensis TaxID=1232428 RepID=UPI002A7559C8|nr:hypothetical protein [Megasphaera massiliensis]MDY2964940.1 hypothetical protein [Megasphaera massiliensis]
MLNRVKKYVRKIGFDAAEKTGTWNDYTVYTPLYKDYRGETMPTGLPVLVLEKEGHLKTVEGEMVFMIFDDMVRKAMESET